MSYLNRNRLKNFFVNLKKYFKSEEFLNSMAISNAEIDNIANTAGYNDNGTGTVNYDFVPRSGGAVMTGSSLGRTVNDSELRIDGGTSDSNGSAILLRGKDKTGNGGETDIVANDGTDSTTVNIKPNGTITRVTNNVTKNFAMQEDVNTLLSSKANSSHTHAKSEITDFPSLATVATSGSYNDLSNKPAIPTYSAGTNLSLSDTTFNVSSTPSFTNITISGYTITVD